MGIEDDKHGAGEVQQGMMWGAIKGEKGSKQDDVTDDAVCGHQPSERIRLAAEVAHAQEPDGDDLRLPDDGGDVRHGELEMRCQIGAHVLLGE